ARPRSSLRRRVLARLWLHRHRHRPARPQFCRRRDRRLALVRRPIVGGGEHPTLQQRADRDRADPARGGDDLRRRPSWRPVEEEAPDMIDAFLHAAMLMTTPILLAAIGGLVNRIGGLVNIGLES